MADYYRRPVPAVCPDGRVRMVRARHYWDGQRHCLGADTFFSVPASVMYRRKYVHGFIDGAPEGAAAPYRFNPHTVCNPWPEKDSAHV